MAFAVLRFIGLSAALLSLATANTSAYDTSISSWVPGFKSCLYQNKTYQVGEKFTPSITVGKKLVKNVCTICTCQPTTLAQCKKVICPELNCSNSVRLPGECCSICLDVTLVEGGQHCVVNGVNFEHGSTFHPPENKDGSNPYCISCKCNNGTTQCQNVSSNCPVPVGCSESEQFVPEGHCCKTCPISKVKQGECLDEQNSVRKNNESWTPTYSGIPVPCLVCTCKDGTTSCIKRPCPPVPLCKPDEPVPSIVLCCPTCSKTATNLTVTEPAPSIIPPMLGSCNDSRYTHKVYLCHDDHGMAIEDTRNNTVQLYNWVQAGVKNIQYMTSNQFYKGNCYLNYIGMAMLRRVNGLTNKQSKVDKINNCKAHCAKMVVQMLRPLRNCSH